MTRKKAFQIGGGEKNRQKHCKTWDEIAKIQKNVRPSVRAGPITSNAVVAHPELKERKFSESIWIPQGHAYRRTQFPHVAQRKISCPFSTASGRVSDASTESIESKLENSPL